MKKKPLYWQIFPYYVMLVLATLLIVAWYSSLSMRQYLLAHFAEDLRDRAHLMTPTILPQFESQNWADLDRICKDIGSRTQMLLSVILSDGRVVGDSDANPADMPSQADRPEILQALSGAEGRTIQFHEGRGQTMMFLALPLPSGGAQPSGILRAALPITSIEQKRSEVWTRIAFFAFFVILAAGAASFFISKRISRPLAEMQKGALRFSRGELVYKLTSPDARELASLAETMNQMASTLNDRIRTIVRQRNELEAVLSSMMEGVLAVDQQERVIISNEALARIFGKRPPELIGRALHEVIRSSDFHRFVRSAMSIPEPLEEDIQLFTDTERTLRVCSTPLKGAQNEEIGTLFLLHDVTNIRFLENVRRDFAVNVSHEIKTPLTAIKGFVETLLQERPVAPAENQRFLKIIEKHVNRLVAIVEDLIGLSRIQEEDQKKAVVLKPAALEPVIQRAVGICEDKAAAKQIRIVYQPHGPIWAPINSALLERAVCNLIDNAVNYSDAGKHVLIYTWAEPGCIQIAVEDFGIGIAKKDQQRIFERFYRVDKARSRESGGTGLGLAIVKHIVNAHQGRIKIESKLGKGSRFIIELPAPEPAAFES